MKIIKESNTKLTATDLNFWKNFNKLLVNLENDYVFDEKDDKALRDAIKKLDKELVSFEKVLSTLFSNVD